MKICRDCKIEKKLTEFYRRGKSRTGKPWYAGRCKKCHLLRFQPKTGRPNLGQFVIGLIPWNKGKKTGIKPVKGFTKGHSINKGIKQSSEHIKKISNTRYVNATSKICKKHQNWKKAVWERDGYKCRKCESKNILCAHHIKHWKEYPELRFEIDNGLTLCCSCHSKLHNKGKIFSADHRMKLHKSHIGKTISKEHRKNISLGLLSYRRSNANK